MAPSKPVRPPPSAVFMAPTKSSRGVQDDLKADVAVPQKGIDSATKDVNNSKLPWSTFEREILHAYHRAYRLNTPTAFSSEYHHWVLTQPGSIGIYSPTIARRKEIRRQSKDALAGVIRKHFDGLGVQENDVIVGFLHKVRSQGGALSRVCKVQRKEYSFRELER